MPLSPPANKPLLLLFPVAQTLNYERCLVVAKHLRPLFEIRFLHTDGQASLVYQHGFETFSNGSFTLHLARSGYNLIELDEKNLELHFLEQVEILETLQPSLVIGDGSATLSMAAEFTGIPLISIINGHQSPYFTNKQPSSMQFKSHQPFQFIREKYGLRQKLKLSEEYEGDLNWICDLPELFPQKELPFHYDLIGPLFEIQKLPTAPSFNTLNPLKKTILIDFQHHKQQEELNLFNETYYKHYNLIAEATKGNLILAKHFRSLQLVNIAQVFDKTDLLLCDTERLMYKALHYGVPVVFTNPCTPPTNLIEALEDWQIGSRGNLKNAIIDNKILEYWTNHKNSDTHRTIQYKIKSAAAIIEHKLLRSLSLHFPLVEKKRITYM